MLSWMIAIALALSAPMLFRWRGRSVYGLVLLLAPGAWLLHGMHATARPGYRGSPGDALGLAIAWMSYLVLAATLVLCVLLRVALAGRRARRKPVPGEMPD